jgi:DNA-binding NtrC family response regulator
MIKALVIDNNKLIQWSLKETLTEEGYETHTIASAEEALNRIMKIPYSLIFFGLDVIKENSLILLDQVNTISPSTRLIVLTCREKHQIELLLSDLDVTSIIEKPFQLDSIKAMARES